jgi:hypothetical protein
MLKRFSTARRKFLDERLAGWTDEERSTLLELLRRFSVTLSMFERSPA